MPLVLEDHFYHKTISLLTGVFGSVFDEIKVVRSNGQTIKVPIAYETKQKYSVRNTQNPDPNEVRKKIILPRMGFKLNSLQRDTTRTTNKMNVLMQANVDRTQVDSVKSQLNRVPYLFGYQLNVKAKTVDDLFQIVEQILVYFNPTLRVNVLDNPDLNGESSITITLLDAGLEDMFEGSFDGEQVLETTLNFSLEGWLYMPTSQAKIIKTVNINYYDMGLGTLLGTDTETA